MLAGPGSNLHATALAISGIILQPPAMLSFTGVLLLRLQDSSVLCILEISLNNLYLLFIIKPHIYQVDASSLTKCLYLLWREVCLP